MPVQFDSATDSLSHWHASADTVVPTHDLPTSADVVVVGAGMLGCWTAYWLAKAGLNPLVLERTAIGWGATGRNGGFLVGGASMGYASLIELLGHDGAKALHELTLHGQALARDVIAKEEIDCDYRQIGTLSLALTETELADMRRSRELLQADGYAGELLDREGVQAHIHTELGEEIVGGTYAPDDGTLHSVKYVRGIAKAAQRHGARFVQADVRSVGDGVIRTDRGQITTGATVIALNAWTAELVPEARDVIVPTRGQILSYAPSEPVFTTAVGAAITPTGEYWQQTPSGHIVIGGCRADAPDGDSGVREMISTEAVIERIGAVLPRLFPQLKSLQAERSWAGLMAFTPDHMPVIDQAASGALFAGGFSGHGMPFGPILGKYLADAVQTGKISEDVADLRLNRPSIPVR